MFFTVLFVFIHFFGKSQELSVLSFDAYMAYVKKQHPIVKQAGLVLTESEAYAMKARGAFDPKLNFDTTEKVFNDKDYYDKLKAGLSIPVGYGLSIKGGYAMNSGVYLNPENNLPENGLYSAGVSLSLAKGFIMNRQMATLKKAKLYEKQAVADNQLMVSDVVYNAAVTYFKWLQNYKEQEVYKAYEKNAKDRFEGVKRGYVLGDKPAIDTIEAKISWRTRTLSYKKAQLSFVKSTLDLSNYLWIDNLPIFVSDELKPQLETAYLFSKDSLSSLISKKIRIDASHPKLSSLSYKLEGLNVTRRLERNNLLPTLNLQYNFLSDARAISTFGLDNYKAGLEFKLPLFLRKERANLKLIQLKIQDLNYEKALVSLNLENKLKAVQQEIEAYTDQIQIATSLVSEYDLLLKGETRKFDLGDSSLFLINSRESKLINNALKLIELENDLLKAKAKRYNVLGLVSY
ncbi:MAG: TolC family protein [Flavicella sp.]